MMFVVAVVVKSEYYSPANTVTWLMLLVVSC